MQLIWKEGKLGDLEGLGRRGRGREMEWEKERKGRGWGLRGLVAENSSIVQIRNLRSQLFLSDNFVTELWDLF